MQTGKKGQPKKNIDPKVLHEAFKKGKQIPLTVIASVLGIDRKTLRSRIKETDIDLDFNKISDNDLDNLVQEYRYENPGGGCSYIIGRLRAVHSLRIQRHRVIDSMNHIDRWVKGYDNALEKRRNEGTIKFLVQMLYGILMATTNSLHGGLLSMV